MADYSRQEAADRAGVSIERLDQLVELGALGAGIHDRFSSGDVRKIGLISSLVDAGLPLESMVDQMRSGEFSVDFLDNQAYEMFSALSPVTFDELSSRTGLPVDLLMGIRAATGSAAPSPTDRMREDELKVVPLLEAQLANNYSATTVDRLLRTLDDSLRRFTTADGDAFFRFVISPVVDRAGPTGADLATAAATATERVVEPLEQAVVAILRGQIWNSRAANIYGKWEQDLVEAGLYSHLRQPPAICFFDITGYTRLTDERGDEAAAELADQMTRLVERTSVRHGGRPVKWLGDGVMLWFREPALGVVAALDMADGVIGAGLPPAHVGLHAGPVVFQQGDYFGQTVNIASRIAEYARPGEVLVSEAVVEASPDVEVAFNDLGHVELKGVSGPVHLHAVHRE